MAALSPTDDSIVTYCEELALVTGEFPEPESIAETLNLHISVVTLALAKREVIDALDRRGILQRAAGYRLSAEQLALANLLLDFADTRSEKNKLAELGITTAKYSAWLTQPAFSAYLRKRSENLLSNTQHVANTALVDSVRGGDINAIKYYNEMTGRFSQKSVGELNIQFVLVKIIEIIQKHVSDPVTLRAIANDLGTLDPGTQQRELVV